MAYLQGSVDVEAYGEEITCGEAVRERPLVGARSSGAVLAYSRSFWCSRAAEFLWVLLGLRFGLLESSLGFGPL
ncbi:hypothetical protein V6Z11_A11G324800 [Gossypium hirsutum]